MCDHNLSRSLTDSVATILKPIYCGSHSFLKWTLNLFVQVSNFPFKRRDNVLLDENGKCPDCIAVLDVDDYYGCVYKQNDKKFYGSSGQKKKMKQSIPFMTNLRIASFELDLDKKSLIEFLMHMV